MSSPNLRTHLHIFPEITRRFELHQSVLFVLRYIGLHVCKLSECARQMVKTRTVMSSLGIDRCLTVRLVGFDDHLGYGSGDNSNAKLSTNVVLWRCPTYENDSRRESNEQRNDANAECYPEHRNATVRGLRGTCGDYL